MIQLSEARPPEYSKIVIQAFSAAQGGWCDYRDLQDHEEDSRVLGMLETVHPGWRFRLVKRMISDHVLPG